MKYAPDITAPVMNLNGSSATALLAQHLAALEALRTAAKAMHETFPHGRDFQTAPPNTYKRAAGQARERCLTIERLIMDYEALAEAISNQQQEATVVPKQEKSHHLDNTVRNRERGGVAVTALQAFVIDNDTDGPITPAVIDRVLAQYPVEGRS